MLEAVRLSPIEFTAITAFLANALEVSPTGTTASHRGTPEILYTIAMAQAHNGSAITRTTMTGRHRTGMAILRILVTAPGAIGSLIKCIATELVDYSAGTPERSKEPRSVPNLDRNFSRLDDRWICASALGRGNVIRRRRIVERDWCASWVLARV
jgi:hypothetical protein